MSTSTKCPFGNEHSRSLPSRHQPAPPPDRPFLDTLVGGRVGVRANGVYRQNDSTAEAAIQKSVGGIAKIATRTLLFKLIPVRLIPARLIPVFCLVALAACQQTGGLGGGSTAGSASGSTSAAMVSSTAPASLQPGASGVSFSQNLAGSGGFANVVDKQGVSWSVQIGQPYDSASGKVCKPLRFTSLSRAGTFDRIACSDKRGIWDVVAPLQGGEGGPSF